MSFLYVLFAAFQAFASPNLRQAYIGSPCGGSAFMQPYSFFAWNYPPVTGEVANFDFVVNVLQDNVNVQEIYITEQLDTNYWNHIEVSVNQVYNTGSAIGIGFQYQYPSAVGSYVVTIQPSNGQHLACWQFAFYIT